MKNKKKEKKMMTNQRILVKINKVQGMVITPLFIIMSKKWLKIRDGLMIKYKMLLKIKIKQRGNIIM
jgi:hypothetical protein